MPCSLAAEPLGRCPARTCRGTCHASDDEAVHRFQGAEAGGQQPQVVAQVAGDDRQLALGAEEHDRLALERGVRLAGPDGRRPAGPVAAEDPERRGARGGVADPGLLLVVAAATTAAGSPDDQGRAGRSISRQCTPDLSASHGPWPGVYYTGRLAAVVLVGLLLAYLALRAIVQRPRAGEVAGDDALRRGSARTVTGPVGVLIAIPLGGVGVIAAGGLLGIDCAPPWWTVIAWGLLALAPIALAIVVWCAATVITPTDPRTP